MGFGLISVCPATCWYHVVKESHKETPFGVGHPIHVDAMCKGKARDVQPLLMV
jgi:hypothetical protein